MSCAGPAAVEYAARNPHRVSKLIFGSFVLGADVGDQAVRAALESLVLASWGVGSRTIANLFAPNLPTESVKSLSRCHRHSASQFHVSRLWSGLIDETQSDSLGADPVLDEPARNAYRDRLRVLDEAME